MFVRPSVSHLVDDLASPRFARLSAAISLGIALLALAAALNA